MSNSNSKRIKDLRDVCNDLVYIEEKIDKLIPGTDLEDRSVHHINRVIQLLKCYTEDLEAADSHRGEK